MFELKVFLTSLRIWVVVFGLFLIIRETLFTFLPITTIGVCILYAVLYKLRNPLPPKDIIRTIFGEDTTTDHDGSTPNGKDIGGKQHKDRMWIIGHRGCGLDAPENTLVAFNKFAERGGKTVEFDVSFTKDSVPILFHDDNILRMTGIDRNIADLNYSELSSIDLATKHPLVNKFERPVKIPTLDDGIACCLNNGLKFFIDIKATDSKIVEVILEAYKKYPGMYQAAIVSSFDPRIIYQIRRSDNNIVGSMAWRPGFCRYSIWDPAGVNLEKRHSLFILDWLAIIMDYIVAWSLPSFLWWFVGLSVILIQKDSVNTRETHIWQKVRGLKLFTWTVNNPIEKMNTSHCLNIGYLTDTMDGNFSATPNGLTSTRIENQPRLTSLSSEMFLTPKDSTVR